MKSIMFLLCLAITSSCDMESRNVTIPDGRDTTGCKCAMRDPMSGQFGCYKTVEMCEASRFSF